MASTSVHLPVDVVAQLDLLAARRGISRNRLIVQACQELLAKKTSEWPDDFFACEMSATDLAELRAGGDELEQAIYAGRRSRVVPPL